MLRSGPQPVYSQTISLYLKLHGSILLFREVLGLLHSVPVPPGRCSVSAALPSGEALNFILVFTPDGE